MATRAQLLAHSLNEQLKRKGACEYHFQKLVDDYCRLFEIKEKLLEDIKQNGVTITEQNVKGFEIHKTNPAVSEMTRVSASMLKILDKLNISADDNIKNSEEEDDSGL